MPASGKVGATTTEDDPSRGLVRGTAASVTTGASRRPGAGLQLERTNLPTRREVARAEATGELLATLREHDTPRRPRPDARPSRAAPLVCLRLTPDHSTPRALRRVQPDRVLPIPRRLHSQAHALAAARGAAGKDDVTINNNNNKKGGKKRGTKGAGQR